MIVKAGFDEPSSSAFIATKVPDQEALKAWVRAYQSFGQAAPQSSGGKPATPGKGPVSDATVELNAFEVQSAMAGKSPPLKPPTVAEIGEELLEGTAAFGPGSSGRSPGEFTRLFRDANAFEPAQRSPTPAPPKPSSSGDAIFGQRLGGTPLGGEKVAPGAPVPSSPEPSSPGSFTREFLGISNEKAEPIGRQSSPVLPTPAQSGPGAFTQEFMAVSPPAPKNAGSTGVQATPKATAAPPATSFENIFGGPTPQPSSSPLSGSTGNFGGEAETQKGGAGEFTSFFRDPFEHPGEPSKSIPMPDVASSPAPQKQVGDFTRMFGPGDVERAQNPTPPPLQEVEAAPGSFTKLFGEISGPGRAVQPEPGGLGTNPSSRPSFLDPVPAPPVPVAADPFHGGMSLTPVAPPLDPFFSRTPAAAPPVANPPIMNRAGAIEATNIFKGPGGDAPPVETAPSGPSDFTMFISRSQLNASMAPPPPGAPVVNLGGGAPPPLAAPAVPAPPPFQFAPPPVPAVPAMKIPPAPAVPAMAAALPPVAPKAPSFWPLVVVFTVLLAIAALLVMYFVLKH
jgi:hypothetical protein